MSADAEIRPSPEALLSQASREGRGRLKVFLGAAPGVGKTYAMLQEGQRRRKRGTDVVVGFVETHSRPLTAEALEGLAARLAAERMSEAEIDELRALIALHERQVAQDHGLAYYQSEGDLDFHFCIVRGSHNARLQDLLENDLYHLVRMYRCQFGMVGPRAPTALREHGQIVEAIAERDGELAEILMRRHIRASRQQVERRCLLYTSPSPRDRTRTRMPSSA